MSLITMTTTTFIATDSISLKFLDKNTLLQGVGNELHMHRYENVAGEESATRKVLLPKLSGKVHGIVLGVSNIILVYGEKDFMLLQWRATDWFFQLLDRTRISDWISAAKFLANENTNEFVILTAHSVLLRFSIDTVTFKCVLIEKCSCSDKSTLYCGHLQGETWKELKVFGGNAFGELLLWQPIAEECDKKAALLQRLPAHNGVVFSIDYNEQHKILTTTSDDRSIRFWQVTSIDDIKAQMHLIPMASGYGHVARVFQGKIISYAKQAYAISVGEDSYFCLWHCNGTLIYKRRLQYGATIWNFEYDEDTQTLYTVGSTGNLIAYDMQYIWEQSLNNTLTMPKVQFEAAEYVAKIKCLEPNLLIGITNKNRFIFRGVGQNSGDDDWQMIADFARYKCTVLEVHQQYIALCGYKHVTLYEYNAKSREFKKRYDNEVLNGVIRAFQFLNANTYLLSDELGNCLLLRDENMQIYYNIELPKCKERWLTTALMIDEAHLLLSNRQGNLMLYKYNSSTTSYELKDTLKQPHGNLGATVLKLQKIGNEKVFIKSAGHDGSLRLLCIDKTLCRLKALVREIVPVAWVEKLLTMPLCNNELLLLGFNDNHFVAWSKQHDFTLQVPCGGGHRCWHYSLHENKAGEHFIQLFFIKQKQVLMQRLPLFNRVLIRQLQQSNKNDWHVRACNIADIITNSTAVNKAHTIIISAGDDNLLKISTYNEDDCLLKQKAEVHTHISNIRALRLWHLNEQECLIFSAGGRAQLCITRLNLDTFQPEELINYTLRATQSLNTNQQHLSKNSIYTFDPETRIMSCDIQHLNAGNEFHIYLGCSDGFLRKLHLKTSFDIVPLSEFYYGNCILQVRIVAASYVLVATTDGLLSFYDLHLKQRIFHLEHHASGINALDVLYETSAQTLHILSGGDDQAVVYTALNISSNEYFKIIKSLHLPNLHTAQVTAAVLHLNAINNQIYAYTSGIDQLLYKYNLVKQTIEERINVQIADIKGLCLSKSKKNSCFLYGCGLQIVADESEN